MVNKKIVERLSENEYKKGVWPVEWAMVAYAAFTSVLMLVLWSDLVDPVPMILQRIGFLALIPLVVWVYRLYPCRLAQFLRLFIIMSTLSRWYPETYEFNRLFCNLDHVFASLEHNLFGCQPSLLFSQAFPQWWVSEPLYLGYFSYFPMMVVLVLFVWYKRPDELMRTAFIVMASFFTYYVIYIFLPVAGPQYYYQVDGVDPVAGVFPNVGHYFHEMRDMYPGAGSDGLFHGLVSTAHDAGERPTAAFPSSHIGVSTIVLMITIRCRLKGLTLGLLPLYLLLCGATVYIHAHYLIDAIAGFITAFIVYFLLSWVWNLLFEKAEKAQRKNPC